MYLTREQMKEVAARLGVRYYKEIEFDDVRLIELNTTLPKLGGHLVFGGVGNAVDFPLDNLLKMTPLTETEVEDHVVELLNLDETQDAIANYCYRLWKTFSVVERTPLTELDIRQLAVLGWRDF